MLEAAALPATPLHQRKHAFFHRSEATCARILVGLVDELSHALGALLHGSFCDVAPLGLLQTHKALARKP